MHVSNNYKFNTNYIFIVSKFKIDNFLIVLEKKHIAFFLMLMMISQDSFKHYHQNHKKTNNCNYQN